MDLKRRLGCGVRVAADQIRALRAAGWGDDRIRGAIESHAEPGLAPWDWTKQARGLAAGARRGPPAAAEILRWGAEAEARDQARERHA